MRKRDGDGGTARGRLTTVGAIVALVLSGLDSSDRPILVRWIDLEAENVDPEA